MTKTMLVCATCGFTAFVDSHAELVANGWRMGLVDGKEQSCCPACQSEVTSAEKPKSAAVAAGGGSR
jgi:hypothetical protein